MSCKAFMQAFSSVCPGVLAHLPSWQLSGSSSSRAPPDPTPLGADTASFLMEPQGPEGKLGPQQPRPPFPRSPELTGGLDTPSGVVGGPGV